MAAPTEIPRGREWLGVVASLAAIVFLDRLSNFIHPLAPFGGLIYLVAVCCLTCWAGLRSALAGCALLVTYAWIIYHFPISPILVRRPEMATTAVVSTAIFYPATAVITWLVRRALLNAAFREREARAVADNELEHRRVVEAELWASEEMRRVIVDSSVDAVIGMDQDGRITLWNPNAERMFGWTREQAIGATVNARIRAPRNGESHNDFSSKADLQSLIVSAARGDGREQVEMVVTTRSGGEISVELNVAEHRAEGGSVFILFARDISDRKRAEEAIKELNARLEERVAERTQQLQIANGELIGFTYSVSHDLRAPLRAIVSNSRIVREEAEAILNEASLERLRRLEGNALKMAQLIENLLQYARIGQVELCSREVDLSDMANRIAEDLKSSGEGSVIVQPGMTVRGDPEMLEMVLFNLMENAWKYVGPAQRPEIEVGSTEDGAYFVRDRGIGFDMKYVDKVWQPFERLHRDSEYPGTGIGLANSKRIVARHGGEMWTQSAPGEGTTMYFHLGRSPHTRELTRRDHAKSG